MDAVAPNTEPDDAGATGSAAVPVGTLLALDLLAILGFVVLGGLRHGVDPIARPGHVLLTAAPFVAGWLLVGGLVGAYADRARADVRHGVRVAVGAWTGGAGVGLTLRGTSLLPGDAPLSFAVVMAGLGALVVGCVRIGALQRLRA
jgi:hypothetical protein